MHFYIFFIIFIDELTYVELKSVDDPDPGDSLLCISTVQSSMISIWIYKCLIISNIELLL